MSVIKNRIQLFSAFGGLILLSAVSTLVSAHYVPKVWPHQGDLWYNGKYYADSFFKWHLNGDWSSSNPGFEMDIAVNANYFSKCTSWTNLPRPYDDCPTAGTSEPNSSIKSFGIGSYNAKAIYSNTNYRAEWYFSGGTATSTNYNLTWAEVAHLSCWWDSPWCMRNVKGNSLMTGYWSFGYQEYYKTWYY